MSETRKGAPPIDVYALPGRAEAFTFFKSTSLCMDERRERPPRTSGADRRHASRMLKILATLVAGATFSASPTHSPFFAGSVCHGLPRKVEDGTTNANN